ncbi:hypothetical protein ACTMU2_22115 [Cupriavidus basilensis]
MAQFHWEPLDGQVPGGQPTDHLHQQAAYIGQCLFGILDAVRQIHRRIECWRSFGPLEDLRGFPVRAIQGIQEIGAAAALQTGARQAAQIVQRAAAEPIEPVGKPGVIVLFVQNLAVSPKAFIHNAFRQAHTFLAAANERRA